MPLLEPGTELSLAQLREIRAEALQELVELQELLVDRPSAGPDRLARGLTARTLVSDALAWAARGAPSEARSDLVAEINVLYDVGVVAAEYYKLFVRDPTPKRPAGRI